MQEKSRPKVEKVDLRTLREQLGLTQKALADALGLERTYISMVESGSRPFSDKLRRRVESLQTSTARDITVNGNSGPVAIQSPGALSVEEGEVSGAMARLELRVGEMEKRLGTIEQLLLRLLNQGSRGK